jgi:peptidoglycan L-alanyl-D-glutamate endopeptidase CwlK
VSRFLIDLDQDVQEMWLEHEARCAVLGIVIVLTQTYRTPEEQAALYAKGRTAPGRIVTHAPPGYSWHQTRRAYDVAIKEFPGDLTPKDWYDGPWGHIGEVGEACGMDWGGRWKRPDRPHFEHHGGKTLAQWREVRKDV